jgi:hypothetical protein
MFLLYEIKYEMHRIKENAKLTSGDIS